MTNISFVMPCYNRSHDLQRILQSYDQQNTQYSFEVIAIDDASTDDTYQILNAYTPSHYTLHVIRQPYNQGPAVARNRGIEIAQSPLIAFVGDDILPAPDFVEHHLKAHQCWPQPEVAILGHVTWAKDLPQNTLMTHIDGIGAQQFSYYYFQPGQEYDFRHFYTANISLKTDFLKQLPYWFDVDFPYAAFEDAELAYRLAQRGLRIIYSEQPVGYHYHYHTIWTFSVRQYRAGLMACEVARKHPKLARFLRITKTRLLWPLGWLERLNSLDKTLVSETANWLEKQALQLSSFYEWFSHPLLDELYLHVLEYYWRKGLIDGIFKNSQVRVEIWSRYTLSYLGKFLISFLDRATEQHIPLPISATSVKQKLAQVSAPLSDRLLKFYQTKGYHLVKQWLYPDIP